MNPRRLTLYINAFTKKTKREFEYQNTLAFIQGRYFVDALMTTVGNMFSGKGHKPFEYPEKPYELGKSSDDINLDEEEIQRQREMFVARFKIMQQNFEINHPKMVDNEEEGQES